MHTARTRKEQLPPTDLFYLNGSGFHHYPPASNSRILLLLLTDTFFQKPQRHSLHTMYRNLQCCLSLAVFELFVMLQCLRFSSLRSSVATVHELQQGEFCNPISRRVVVFMNFWDFITYVIVTVIMLAQEAPRVQKHGEFLNFSVCTMPDEFSRCFLLMLIKFQACDFVNLT